MKIFKNHQFLVQVRFWISLYLTMRIKWFNVFEIILLLSIITEKTTNFRSKSSRSGRDYIKPQKVSLQKTAVSFR